MSESTEELTTAVKGAREALTETENQTEELSSQAAELAEEASSHGWAALAARLQEAIDALRETAAHLAAGGKSCDTAAGELDLITDKIPAEEVVGHLAVSTTQLSEVVTSLQGALEKTTEAQEAATEVGQEGLMQATERLYNEISEIRDTVTSQEATSKEEKDAADLFVKKQLGN